MGTPSELMLAAVTVTVYGPETPAGAPIAPGLGGGELTYLVYPGSVLLDESAAPPRFASIVRDPAVAT